MKHNTHLELIDGDYQYIALHRGNPIQKQWHRNRHNLIRYLHFFSKNSVLLDAGCGSGNVILEFSPSIHSSIGIDANTKCITFLNNKIKEMKITNAKGIHMDLLNITLPKHTFNRIILTEVIEHFSQEDGEKILRQLKSCLDANGELLITTPNYHSAWAFLETFMDLLHLSPRLWGDQHLIKFTPEKLTQLLQSSGFIVKKRGTLNFLSPFFAIFSQKLADTFAIAEFKFIPFGNLLFAVAVPQ